MALGNITRNWIMARGPVVNSPASSLFSPVLQYISCNCFNVSLSFTVAIIRFKVNNCRKNRIFKKWNELPRWKSELHVIRLFEQTLNDYLHQCYGEILYHVAEKHKAVYIQCLRTWDLEPSRTKFKSHLHDLHGGTQL